MRDGLSQFYGINIFFVYNGLSDYSSKSKQKAICEIWLDQEFEVASNYKIYTNAIYNICFLELLFVRHALLVNELIS